MKRRAGRNIKDEEAQAPDCCVCVLRKDCENAEEGSFCTRFRSGEAAPRGEDPNELWKKGEEVEF